MMLLIMLSLSSGKNTFQELKFVPIEEIKVRVDSGPSFVLLRSEEEFKKFLQEHGLVSPEEKSLQIDFKRYMLIGVFSGKRPTGGYSLYIERVLRKGDTLIIHAVEKCPDPNSMVIQVITYPSVFFTIEKFYPKEVILEFEQCYGKKQIKKVRRDYLR